MPDRIPVPDAPPPPRGWPGPHGTLRPPGPPIAGPGIRLAVVAIVLFLLGQLAAVLAVGDRIPLVAVAVLGQSLGLVAALVLLRMRSIRLADIVGPVRPALPRLLAGLGLGAATLVVTSLAVAVLVGLSGSEAVPQQFVVDEVLAGGLRTVLAVVAAVLLAPIAEELLFRGLLYRALRVSRSVGAAALLSSAPFAVVHLEVVLSQPLALVALLVVGVVLALVYERTGGLLVPVALHAGYNATALAAAVALGRSGILPVASGLT